MRNSANSLRTVVKALVLVGIGVAAGLLFKAPPVVPLALRRFSVCASPAQYLVEFRMNDRNVFTLPPSDITGALLLRGFMTVEVDGEPYGTVPFGGKPIRRFLCEGNHEMRITFPRARAVMETEGEKEAHRLVFAVSRRSVFYVTEQDMMGFSSCESSKSCTVEIALELSQDDPDRKAQLSAASKE